jgi:hypothetical protein
MPGTACITREQFRQLSRMSTGLRVGCPRNSGALTLNTTERSRELVESLRAAYGNLERPNHSFMEKRYGALLHHPFITDAMSRYFVKNETDLNDHASFHLRVLHDNGSMMVCLSFVDNWAMLFRLEEVNPIYAEVIEPSSSRVLSAEREMMRLLEQHGFTLVTRREAAAPVEMNLFHTDRTESRVYHAIIADDGIVPKVLLD